MDYEELIDYAGFDTLVLQYTPNSPFPSQRFKLWAMMYKKA